MKILIVQPDNDWLGIASTSLIKGFYGSYNNPNITWLAGDEMQHILRYNKKINTVETNADSLSNHHFNLIVNLSTDPDMSYICNIIEHDRLEGFCLNKGKEVSCTSEYSKLLFDVLNKSKYVDKHILRLIFGASGLTWRGEGYDLSYFPKNKEKKGKTGIALENDNLREYVKSNLKLKNSNIWHIPIKKNILKRIDEINRCKRIVTDNLFVVHASIAMRKHVEFLDLYNSNIKIEFFNSGNHNKIHNVQRYLQMQ